MDGKGLRTAKAEARKPLGDAVELELELRQVAVTEAEEATFFRLRNRS